MTAQTSTKRKKSRSDKRMPGDNTLLTKGAQAKARIISVAETLFNKGSGLAEVVIPPRSKLIGQTMFAGMAAAGLEGRPPGNAEAAEGMARLPVYYAGPWAHGDGVDVGHPSSRRSSSTSTLPTSTALCRGRSATSDARSGGTAPTCSSPRRTPMRFEGPPR